MQILYYVFFFLFFFSFNFSKANAQWDISYFDLHMNTENSLSTYSYSRPWWYLSAFEVWSKVGVC